MPEPQLGTQGDVLGQRILAFLVDGVIIAVAFGVFTALMTFLGMNQGSVMGVVGTLFGLLVFAYFVYFEGTSGQTLGKQVMGIMVTTEEGADISMTDSLIRNVLRIVDTLPMLYILGIIVILATEDSQRIGDLAANTLVVKAS